MCNVIFIFQSFGLFKFPNTKKVLLKKFMSMALQKIFTKYFCSSRKALTGVGATSGRGNIRKGVMKMMK